MIVISNVVGRARPPGNPSVRLLPLVLLLLATGIGPLATAPRLEGQAPPPHADYRTFDTPHFRVVYAEGLREVALRAAAHAEEGHRILRETFLPAPTQRIELLVTDHADLANGFAMSTPRPRIVVWARPPMEAGSLSHFDDWIGLVSMHELAHVFHLEYVGGPGRALRRVFGRASHAWPFFPGHLLPQWAIEGAAVHYETVLTESGRLHGTHHQATVRAQALDGGVETLGQALGRSPVWPGAARPYVYGSLFFEWLEERHGPGTVRDFLREAGEQWIPYRLDPPARAATGRPLGELWEEWRQEVEAEAREVAREGRSADLELLTLGARSALHPAPDPSGSGRIAYLRADGRSDTRLVVRGPDGEERTLSRWNDASGPVWTTDGSLLATQPEFVDRWRLRRDVYRVAPDGGVERLTRGLRISHVDARPGDGRMVAVQDTGGTNRLVLLSAEGVEETVLREADPGVHWASPRWSPDGSTIAVVRWRRGGWTSVVLLSPGGEDGERVVLEDRSLHAGPAWSSDGDWLFWASDRDGAFNLYAARVGERELAIPLRQVTRSVSGAMHPAPDPESRWIYHSRLRGGGWELARVPFDPAAWSEPAEPDPRFHGVAADSGPVGEGGDARAAHEPPPAEIVREDRPWRPATSALPTYWLPTHAPPERMGSVEVLPRAFGIETSGHDLVGRHRWSFRSTVPLPGLDSRPEMQARWRWAGLGQPALVFRADQRLSPLAPLEAPGVEGDTLYPVARERSAGVDAEVVRQRVRSVVILSSGLREVRQHRTLQEADGRASERFQLSRPDRTLTEVRAGAGFSTARSHPFSVSPEEGFTLQLQLRRRWERLLPDTLAGVPGLDGSLDEAIVFGRVFRPVPVAGPIPAFARASFGFRGAFGIAEGPGAGTGHFRIGGGGGGGEGPAGFTWGGGNPLFSVRGYPRGAAWGDRAWAAGAELRFPLANLHTGRNAVPLHLDRMAAALFFDAAGAGRAASPSELEGFPPAGPGEARRWERRSSVGVEAALTHTLFFGDLARLRAGVAFPLTPGARPGVYVQSGWSF